MISHFKKGKEKIMNKAIMKAAGFGKEVEMVENGYCPDHGEKIPIQGFKDDLSRKEFTISGLCQECQDSVFG